MNPITRYARNGEVNIAYQVVGDGPIDLVLALGWVTHLDANWDEPGLARFLRRLASFSRLIIFDKRGSGLSDRVAITHLPTIEQRMDDVRAVMDAADSERAALFGISDGGTMTLLFGATHPERTSALVGYGTYGRRAWAPDYPWAPTPEERQRFFDTIDRLWGGVVDLATLAPTMSEDESFKRWWAAYLRQAASPGAALAMARMNTTIDIREIVPSISVPTLILHRAGDRDVKSEEARWLAGQIPGARFVELPGDDSLPWVGNSNALLDEVQEFLTGVRPGAEAERMLATILVTDIVGATERAAALGDRHWSDLLERHHALVRRELQRFDGSEIDTAGDGFLASFPGPARAIRCARSVVETVRELGIEVRTGIHTGECELLDDKPTGIAVHLAARVAQSARPGEVLVSNTVREILVGTGFNFAERGEHRLKGIPGEWRLFAVRPAQVAAEPRVG